MADGHVERTALVMRLADAELPQPAVSIASTGRRRPRYWERIHAGDAKRVPTLRPHGAPPALLLRRTRRRDCRHTDAGTLLVRDEPRFA